MFILAHLTAVEAPAFWIAFLAGASVGAVAAWSVVHWKRR